MIVMMIAITPSLKASSLVVPIRLQVEVSRHYPVGLHIVPQHVRLSSFLPKSNLLVKPDCAWILEPHAEADCLSSKGARDILACFHHRLCDAFAVPALLDIKSKELYRSHKLRARLRSWEADHRESCRLIVHFGDQISQRRIVDFSELDVAAV